MLLTQGSWDEVRVGPLRTLSLAGRNEIWREKHKGYPNSQYSNGLELQFLTCTVTWVF